MVVPYQAIIDNVIYGYGANPGSPIAEGMVTHTDEFFTYDQGTVEEAKALLTAGRLPERLHRGPGRAAGGSGARGLGHLDSIRAWPRSA